MEVQQLIEEQKEQLEIKVEERTKSLQETNEELKLSEENLDKLNKTKDHFFAIISHELRASVSSFQGIARILQYQIKKDKTARVDQIMEQVDSSANQLNTLLDNLLQWSQTQLDGISYNPEAIMLNTISQDVERMYAGIAQTKGVKIITDIEPENLLIWADFPTSSAILRNLWGNALKFTENGSITIKARKKGEQVQISITDTGVGISPEKLAIIFDIDPSKSTKGTQGEKGNGLGLLLCKEFAEKNGGSLHIESEVGKGTSVHLHLHHRQLF